VKKIINWPLFYPLLLFLLTLFIAFSNYTPGTYLTGWDTLHPEFDFPTNFSRLIFGVWRSDQGLGALAGHSHMADLPRVFLLWIFHFFLPNSLLRYSYIFLCLIIGPLSFYYLIRYLIKKLPHTHLIAPLIAFLSSLFYLLNLGTLQQFYVPFEMFPTQWALLPLIFLFSLRYLENKKRKDLLFFSLTTLFATPQAYAAHLWYAFFALYTLFLIIYSLLHHQSFKNSLKLFFFTLLLNSFWLLPNLYYVATSTTIAQTNKTNRLFSQEFLLKNRETGTLADTSLIKGFYFNWDSFNSSSSSSQDLMPLWNQHLENLDIQVIGNLLFLLSLTGLIAVFLRKNKLFLPFTPLFILSFALLANRTPFFSQFFDLLLKISLFQQLFRFVFTKLSILLTFSISLFFSYTLYLLFTSFSHHFRKIFSTILIISLFIYSFPYFQGQLISPIVRVKIPTDYFSLNQKLQSLPQGKVLTLPLQSFSGWQYYDWGYQGSGHIWFGSPQAFFDRDSDRWQPLNEEAYQEFYYPLYSNNHSQFLSSLHKYQVQYLLWDKSNIATSKKNQQQITFQNEIRWLLDELIKSGDITLAFESGNLELYSLHKNTPLLKAQQINTFISPSYSKNYFDYQYQSQDYLTTNTDKDKYYPFRSILRFDNRLDQTKLQVIQEGSSFYLKGPSTSPIQVIGTSYPIQSLLSTNPKLNLKNNSLEIASFDDTNTLSFTLPIPHSYSYLIGIKSQYISGLPLRFCLYNTYTNLCTFEDQLSEFKSDSWDYFLIPPMDEFDTYELRLSAVSYGHQETKSLLSQITLIQVPYQSLASSFQKPEEQSPNQNLNTDFQILWPNNTLIKANIKDLKNTNNYLTLYQSYHPHWLAFFFKDNKPQFLKEHYLTTNWAISWNIDNLQNQTIYILFWPQLLQFLGFILIPTTLLLVLKRQK